MIADKKPSDKIEELAVNAMLDRKGATIITHDRVDGIIDYLDECARLSSLPSHPFETETTRGQLQAGLNAVADVLGRPGLIVGEHAEAVANLKAQRDQWQSSSAINHRDCERAERELAREKETSQERHDELVAEKAARITWYDSALLSRAELKKEQFEHEKTRVELAAEKRSVAFQVARCDGWIKAAEELQDKVNAHCPIVVGSVWMSKGCRYTVTSIEEGSSYPIALNNYSKFSEKYLRENFTLLSSG